MDTPQREDDALFRYQLIAPLLDPDRQRGDQAQQLKAIAGQEHPHPVRGRVRRSVASLKRYLRRYRQAGRGQSKVQVLQRKERTDKGSTRRLRPEVLELAVQLRKEVPERSVAQVIHLMELQGRFRPGRFPGRLWTVTSVPRGVHGPRFRPVQRASGAGNVTGATPCGSRTPNWGRTCPTRLIPKGSGCGEPSCWPSLTTAAASLRTPSSIGT